MLQLCEGGEAGIAAMFLRGRMSWFCGVLLCAVLYSALPDERWVMDVG